MDLELIYREGNAKRRRRFPPGKISIGRHPGCDVVLDGPEVAPLHAYANWDRGRWVLSAAGENTAFELRGRRLKYVVLAALTQVSIGNVRLTFLVRPAEAGAVAPQPSGEVRSALPVDSFDSLLDSVLDPGRSQSARVTGALGVVQLLQLVRSAAEAFVGQHDTDALLDTICELVFAHVSVERVFVLLGPGPAIEMTQRAFRARPGIRADRIDVSHTIADESLSRRHALLVVEADSDERFRHAPSVAELGIRSALCAPLIDHDRIQGLLYADRTSEAFRPNDLETLSILASLAAAALQRQGMQDKLEGERRMRERLSRYHAPSVVEHVLRSGADGGMIAEEREISVLFADIVGFTALSERLPATRVQALLNTVLSALADEVFEEHGTLDKFIGDAAMVFFGAPVQQPDHALRAVRTALAMHRRVAELRSSDPDLAGLALRVGINTGPATVGEIGSASRRDYTVIGDTVNVASRLESSVASPGETVVNQSTYRDVERHVIAQPLEEICVRGRETPIRPWRIDALRRPEEPA